MDASIVTEVIQARGVTTTPGGVSLPPHVHHFHQLDIVQSGSLRAWVEDRRALVVQAGEALLIPPLVRHSFRTETTVRHMVFKFHLATAFWPVLGVRPRRLRLSSRLVEELSDWGQRLKRQSPFHAQQGRAALTLCLIDIARAFPEEPVAVEGSGLFRRQLWRMLEQITHDPYAPWSIAQLAEQAHLSRPHFSRCFQKVVGRTPKRYLLEARLGAAAAEIAGEPTRPLKEISQAAGYASIHPFTMAFTKLFGVSPGAYRRRPVKF